MNLLDATLTVIGINRGSVELNPLWTTYSPLHAMSIKLALAFLAGMWFYMAGWKMALRAASICLAIVVLVNVTTLIIQA